MKCIFCLQQKEPSDEHVIPESVGGRIRIKEVCRECNNNLSRLVDGPFAMCPLIELPRFTHSIGGKRGVIPSPFSGVGTLKDGTKVTLDRSLQPHIIRGFEATRTAEGHLDIFFSADASDKDKFGQMLGKPIRKLIKSEFPDWPEEKVAREVAELVDHAEAATPVSDHGEIKNRWCVGLDDLLFEFLKIAYEMWFRTFGYSWIETSNTAANIRVAILNRDSGLPIRGKLFAPEPRIPLSDPFKNHCILQMRGICFIRIFNVSCSVECERTDQRFILSADAARILLQEFLDHGSSRRKLRRFCRGEFAALRRWDGVQPTCLTCDR